MRCSASPTTCTAADPAREAAQRIVASVVFREILKPLAAGLGPLGDVVAGSVADSIGAPPVPRSGAVRDGR
jgi:hypothetical protein